MIDLTKKHRDFELHKWIFSFIDGYLENWAVRFGILLNRGMIMSTNDQVGGDLTICHMNYIELPIYI